MEKKKNTKTLTETTKETSQDNGQMSGTKEKAGVVTELQPDDTMRDESGKMPQMKKDSSASGVEIKGKKKISAESGGKGKGKKAESTETAKGSKEKGKKKKKKRNVSKEKTAKLSSLENLSEELINSKRSAERLSHEPEFDEEGYQQLVRENLGRPIKRTRMTVGTDNRIETEPWKWSDWKDNICLFAILTVLLDASQNSELISYAPQGGGFFYILLYIVLVTVIQLPLLVIYVHTGHYHRVGTLKAFKLYGPIYRAIGICFFLMMPFRHGLDTHAVAANLISARSTDNMSKLLSCTDNPYSCFEDYPNRETCCYSLYDKMQCSKLDNPPSWCNRKQIYSNGISAAIYNSNGWEESMRSNQWVPVACLSLVIFFGLIASVAPPYIFLALVSLFGILGFIFFTLIKTTMLISIGDFSTGFWRLWNFTRVNRVFSVKVLFMVTNHILWTGSAKLSVISLASMVSPNCHHPHHPRVHHPFQRIG